MRNMAFSLTTKQMYEHTKTVTRRLGWWFLKPGDVVMAVEKGMGLKKGEHIKRIYPIEIVSTDRVYLDCLDQAEVNREGFPEMTPSQFMEMFCKANKFTPGTIIPVNRIEFRAMGGITPAPTDPPSALESGSALPKSAGG